MAVFASKTTKNGAQDLSHTGMEGLQDTASGSHRLPEESVQFWVGYGSEYTRAPVEVGGMLASRLFTTSPNAGSAH